MRRQLLDALHTAGRKLKGMDDAYAESIYELIEGSKLNDSLKAIGAMSAGAPLTGIRLAPNHGLTGKDLLVNKGIVGAAMASNAGIRYGIPAIGAASLANGINGLYNIASETPVFPQDQTNQLPV